MDSTYARTYYEHQRKDYYKLCHSEHHHGRYAHCNRLFTELYADKNNDAGKSDQT